MNKYFLFTSMAVMFSLAACNSGNANKTEAMNAATQNAAGAAKPEDQKKIIEEYVNKKGLKGEFTPSGLFVAIETEGSGEFPTASNTVKAEYTGYLLDGSVFDASTPGSPIEFGLNEVIPGWTEGLQKFKKGGKGKLIIPSSLGYGPNGAGPIPPNSILAFDITLVDFK